MGGEGDCPNAPNGLLTGEGTKALHYVHVQLSCVVFYRGTYMGRLCGLQVESHVVSMWCSQLWCGAFEFDGLNLNEMLLMSN